MARKMAASGAVDAGLFDLAGHQAADHDGVEGLAAVGEKTSSLVRSMRHGRISSR